MSIIDDIKEQAKREGKELVEARGIQVSSKQEAIEIGEKTGNRFVEILNDIPMFNFKKGDIVQVYASNEHAVLVYSNNEEDIVVGYIPRLINNENYRRINFQ